MKITDLILNHLLKTKKNYIDNNNDNNINIVVNKE
jgi:hypothetical protein